jgi:subtilase family serine protease
MRRLKILSQFAAAALLFCGSSLVAQVSVVAPRIVGPPEDSSLTTLTGNVPLLARAQFDQGAAAASTQLTHVRLVLSRSSEQETALDQFMAEQQQKSSPNYHKWLTPELFGKLYGPADSDIAAIVAWLESKGLTLETVSTGRTDIAFSGTVGQVEPAFHTSIHSFDANGEKFTSNVTDPKIPAALASVISGVASLNTIRPKHHHAGGAMGKFDAGLGRMVPVSSEAMGIAKPQLTTGSVSNYVLYVVPGDAAVIYNTPNRALNPAFVPGPSYSGLGVTIGIAGRAEIQQSTVQSYRSTFLADTTAPIITTVGAVSTANDQDEAYIDTELAGALAPGATIHYYTSTDLTSAIQLMVNDNKVDIVSVSFGACELQNTTAGNASINGWWKQAAAQGIAVVVSTGDSGSAGCDDPTGQTAATGGLAVSGFASTPYNIAVGGTDFDGLVAKFDTYVNTNTTTQGATRYRTAKSYIPESTWNDSVQVDGAIVANAPSVDPKTSLNNIIAGGGGVSTCSTNTSGTTPPGTCTGGYAKPSWQRGPGVPADGARDLPDVSLMSGNGIDLAAWLVCTDNTETVGGVTVTANCTDNPSDRQFYFGGYGGTSTAAPAFAGILAMVQEKTGSRLGQAAKNLYDLYNSSHASAVFHDITVGNNSVPCIVGSTACKKDARGFSYFLTSYDAGTGYDLATGLGSVDATALVNYWTIATGAGTATVTLTPSLTALAVDQSLTVTAAVAGGLGTATGTLTLSSGGYTSPAQTLSGGSARFTIASGTLTKGADTLTVTYSGNAAYATQTGTASVTVTALTPAVTMTSSVSSMYPNAALTVTGNVAGTGGIPTGTVTVTGGGYTSTAQTLSSGAFSIVIPPNSLSIGSVTLTVNYSGDRVYNAGTNSAAVAVTKGTFTLAASDVTMGSGATSGNVSMLTVTPVGGYSGTIALTAAVTVSPAGASVIPTLTGGTVTIAGAAAATGGITVGTTARAASLRAGLNRGTEWFEAAGGTGLAALMLMLMPIGSRRFRRMTGAIFLIAVIGFSAVGCKGFFDAPTTTTTTTKGTATVTVTPAKTSIAVTDALSVAVSVTGSSTTPTGTVTLVGGSYTSAATTLSSGAATINVPANSLASGANTLTVSYAGDTNYNTATGTASVTVSPAGTTAGAYTITVTGTGNDSPATVATTTFTLTVN